MAEVSNSRLVTHGMFSVRCITGAVYFINMSKLLLLERRAIKRFNCRSNRSGAKAQRLQRYAEAIRWRTYDGR